MPTQRSLFVLALCGTLLAYAIQAGLSPNPTRWARFSVVFASLDNMASPTFRPRDFLRLQSNAGAPLLTSFVSYLWDSVSR